jgi:predicted HTH transcriptional regulator
MAEAGLPEPEYRQSEFMLYATLKNKNWGKEDASWADTAQDQDLSGKGPEKGPEKRPETKSDEMVVRSEAVLKEIIADRKISRPKLASKLNLTEKQVRAAIDRLKAEGKIRFEGTGRGGHWIISE